MRIASRQRKLMFQGKGRDPNVVFRDGCAGFGQLRPEAAIMFRSRHSWREHSDGGEKSLNLRQVLGRILRQVRSAVEFAQGGLGQEQSRTGLDFAHPRPCRP